MLRRDFVVICRSGVLGCNGGNARYQLRDERRLPESNFALIGAGVCPKCP